MFYNAADVLREGEIWTCKSSQKPLIEEEISVLSEEELDTEGEHFILCRNCGNPITSLESIISINGEHKHTFTNPAGVTYQIGCFSSADGCLNCSDPTLEFTWFDGFSWRISFCSRCLIHLGWFYQSQESSFFGLILDRLMETTKTH